jgi:hypothetical protein
MVNHLSSALPDGKNIFHHIYSLPDSIPVSSNYGFTTDTWNTARSTQQLPALHPSKSLTLKMAIAVVAKMSEKLEQSVCHILHLESYIPLHTQRP